LCGILTLGDYSTFKPLTPLSVEHRKENGTAVLPFHISSLTLICVEFGTYIYLKFIQV
jgi:hypothetical protein